MVARPPAGGLRVGSGPGWRRVQMKANTNADMD